MSEPLLEHQFSTHLGDENTNTNDCAYASAPSADAGAINDADDAPAAVVSGSEDLAPATTTNDHGSPTSGSLTIDTTTDVSEMHEMFVHLGEDEITGFGEKVMAFLTCDTCQGKDGKTIEQLVDIGVEAAREQQPLPISMEEFESSDTVRLPVPHLGFYGRAFICACYAAAICAVAAGCLFKLHSVAVGCAVLFGGTPAIALLILFLFGQRRVIFLDKTDKTLKIQYRRFFCTSYFVNDERSIPIDRLRLKLQRVARKFRFRGHKPDMSKPYALLILCDGFTDAELTGLKSVDVGDRPWWACLAPCCSPPCKHWQSNLAYYYAQHVFLFQSISGEKFTHYGLEGVFRPPPSQRYV